MNSRKTVLWILACAVVLTPSLICGQQKGGTSQDQFPSEISAEYEGKQHSLKITGTATRTKLFLTVYHIAHYMENPPKGQGNTLFDEILNENQIKQFTSIWTRDVDVKRVQDGYRESLQKAIPANEMNTMRPLMDQYIRFFNQNVKKSDHHVIRWLPDGTVEVEINGQKKGSLQNQAFAHILWGVWLGNKSVVNHNGLISKIEK